MGKKIITKNLIFIVFLTLFVSGVFAFFGTSVFASSTDGTIDSTYKYAWSENIGWINFGTSNGNVHVTDSGLSGYALSETVGWIYLGDITNDGEGNLSGYAWSENTGWIKFNPTNGRVIINSSGEFTGSALGENIGWIIFDCSTSACVKTDWRPQSVRPACNNATDDDGDGKTDYPSDPGCDSLTDTDETDPVSGGGGMPIAWHNPPKAPEQGFRILINNDAEYTNSPTVTLNLFGGSDTVRMAISNFPDFRDAGQKLYQKEIQWTLLPISESELVNPLTRELNNEIIRTVYAKFYTDWGQPSPVVSDSIIYTLKEVAPSEEEKPIVEMPEVIKKISEVVKEIPEKISKIIKKIPEILKPKPPEEIKPPEVPIEELVPKEAPLAFQGKWQLLPSKPIREFVLAPLPKEIRNLAEKFPELKETLKKIGITKITDIEKLKTTKLTLPGLKEGKQIPSEIVFARFGGVPDPTGRRPGGNLVDFNIALSVTEKGEPQQKISTISGKPLTLVVKPEKPVESIKGYIVFKSKKISKINDQFLISNYSNQIPNPNNQNNLDIRHSKIGNSLGQLEQLGQLEISLNSLLSSVFFALPSFAKAHDQPVRVEEKLVLLEFEYTDPDGDGIYTAEIQAPLIEGEYEIITVMDFEDPELGTKEIRLVTVVDPEGYIYTQLPEGKLRIAGAIVSLYWLNPETKQYQLWPAKEYQQENPQNTDDTGKYSFLVPPGTYYLRVEHPNYPVYQSETFVVKEGSGIHINIELKTKYWWLKNIDWKTILLIVVILLLIYNFYRDRVREKLQK